MAMCFLYVIIIITIIGARNKRESYLEHTKREDS